MVGKFGLFATCCCFGADAIYLFGKEADRVLHGGLGYDRVRLIDAVKKGACAGRPWVVEEKGFFVGGSANISVYLRRVSCSRPEIAFRGMSVPFFTL
ncbi:MAG: hypothetical protein ACLR8Y_01805 [Alistipes indistinctus]